ncbi:hypothetical protein [Viscerimonas tarda]
MKISRLFLLAVLLSNIAISFAQQSKFAPVGASWYYSLERMEFSFQHCECIKDSVSDENSKVYQIISGASNEILYQESNKVYFLFEGTPYLIYDFNALQGETYTFYAKSYDPSDFSKEIVLPVKYRVEQVSELLIEGNSYKRFETLLVPDESYLTQEGYNYPSAYIYNEKTGNEQMFILTVLPPHPSIDDYNLRCYSNGEVNYISDYWKKFNKPCDYSLSSSIGETKKAEVQLLINKNERIATIRTSSLNAIMEVFNEQGISCRKKRLSDGAENTLNLVGLPAGIYVFVMYNSREEKIYVQEVIL